MKKQPNRTRQRIVQTDLVSMTQQHHAQGATPREIMETFARTGTMLQKNRTPLPEVPSGSFHEMLNTVADVQFAFSSLPAAARRRFGNDPYQALRFVEDPKNLSEAAKLGLLSDEAAARVKAAEAAQNPPADSPPAS